ncbi:glycosyl hydrolase family 28 protein, partial [Veillonella sp. ZSJB6]
MSGSIRNITISNCIFQETDRGIRLKSRRGRGGNVEDIRVSNIVMDNVMCPFILNLYYFCGPRGKEPYVWEKTAYPIDERTPAFRRIH